jgi:hypothetical protein
MKTGNGKSKGYSSLVSHPENAKQPWPRGSDKFTRVYYCYATSDDRTRYEQWVNEGWSMWTGKFGCLTLILDRGTACQIQYVHLACIRRCSLSWNLC